MARPATRYVCRDCGSVHGKWAGRCEGCGAWNSLEEEAARPAAPGSIDAARGRRPSAAAMAAPVAFVGLDGAYDRPARRQTGIGELDRVLGGGLVAGSAVLIGGDPGIGKSTLLLQACAGLARSGTAVFISGEEALDQIRMRADRLGIRNNPVQLAAATSVRDIVATLDRPDAPAAVVIDSIQTMFVDVLESAPGTVSQVRASAQELIRAAKARGTVLLLVGHVTKDGAIAGPRVLEHMVDTVLYFEGERGHQFRLLRSVKNRFGPTDEIGVFEMGARGLAQVKNPSSLFLSDRPREAAGSCVFAGIEGTRPLLVEIQALVAPSPFGTPRRAVIGWDAGRLAMVLAVLDARCGISLGPSDVFLNIAGGLRIAEPAADLAVAAALLSSLRGEPVPGATVAFGEIGLSAEIRAVPQAEARLKEAAKLGFRRAILPARRKGGGTAREGGMAVTEIAGLGELVELFGPDRRLGRRVG